MKINKNYIYGIAIIIVLLLVASLFIFQNASKESSINELISEFFSVFYNITPNTINSIVQKDSSNENVTFSSKEFVEKNYNGLYTQSFYDQFFIGDRYLVMAPQIASEKNITMSYSSVKLTETPTKDKYKDKYYEFTVEFILKDNLNDNETLLINKGQIRLKREGFKYRINAIKFYDDKLINYLD